MNYEILTPLLGRYWSLLEAARELAMNEHQLLDILESLDKNEDAILETTWAIDTEFDCLIFSLVDREEQDDANG